MIKFEPPVEELGKMNKLYKKVRADLIEYGHLPDCEKSDLSLNCCNCENRRIFIAGIMLSNANPDEILTNESIKQDAKRWDFVRKNPFRAADILVQVPVNKPNRWKQKVDNLIDDEMLEW